MAWTSPKTWTAAVLSVADMNTYVSDNDTFLKKNIALEAATELTISAGSITVTQAHHRIDTEADAASDDLDTIAGGTEGTVIFLRAESAARIVIIKHGTGNIYPGANITLDAITKYVSFIKHNNTNWYLLNTARNLTFTVNAFQYPAPGTDWTPAITGATLGVGKTAKICWLPLNFLKIGDIITSYNLVGDMIVAGTSTLDCKIVRVNKADPLTTTDLTNGGIAQQTANGNFDVTANVNDETVATDKQYLLQITGTTDAADEIKVMGAEVIITRLI